MLRVDVPFGGAAALSALALALALPLGAAELRPRFAADPSADRLLTWEVVAGPAGWRVRDIDKTPVLELTGPDGVVVPRPCYDDGTALLVRHTPRLAGEWHWRLLDPAGRAAGEGGFAVAAPAAPLGPLRVSADNPRLLAFADGTPFIPIGPNVCWADGPDHADGYERWLRTLADNGCNHTRVWMCSWSLGIEGDSPGAWRLERAAQLDRVLERARELKLRLTLVLDNHTDVQEGTGCPYGATLEERQKRFFDPELDPWWRQRVRYCLARWGADDTVLAWEAMNEADLALPVRERIIPWLRAALGFIGRNDPDRRLRTLSWCGSDWPRVVAAAQPDLVQVHSYVLEYAGVEEELKEPGRDGVGLVLAETARAQPAGRPVFLGECGYQGRDDHNPGIAADTGGLLMRQQAWAGLLAGGCAPAMPWWWYNHIEPNRLWKLWRPLAAAAARIDWRDRDLAPLAPGAPPLRVLGWQSPRQALLWPQLAADTWHAHLIAGRNRPGIAAGTRLRLAGLQAGRRFRVVAIDQLGSPERDLPDVVAGADGRGDLVLQAGPSDLVYWLAVRP